MARTNKKRVTREDLVIDSPSLFTKYIEFLDEKNKILIYISLMMFFSFYFLFENYIISFIISINLLFINFINSILLKFATHGLLQEDIVGQFEIDGYKKDKKDITDKYMLMGYSVNKITDIPDPAMVFRDPKVKKKLQYPIFIDKDFTLRHGLIVGTTGSGKTVLIRCLLSQILGSGGGLMIVDGKADQATYEDFYNTIVAYNREDDFYMLNLSTPEESNTMNPLKSGNIDDIAELLSNMLSTEGGGDTYWVERGQILMKSLLSLLVPLRDMDELFFPDGSPAQGLDFTLLTKWLGMNELNDLLYKIKDEWNTARANNVVEHPDYIELKRLEAYLQSNGVNVQEKADIPEEAVRQHGFAMSQWTSALDTLMGTYGEVFDTQTPEIDMFDIITGGRILYVMLPALRKSESTLKSLGKLVLATLKISLVALLGDKLSGTEEERFAGFASRPRVPFVAIMDEYGAYAVKGFDNVLAQARSLQVGILIAVQELASLEKADEIEAKRIMGNTAYKIILKVVEESTIETLQKIGGMEDRAIANEQNENAKELSFNVQEKSVLDATVLKKLKGGQGFAVINGLVSPMLVAFYEPPVCRSIPKFSNYQKAIKGKPLMKQELADIHKIKEQYLKEHDKEEITSKLLIRQFKQKDTELLVKEFLNKKIDYAKNLERKLVGEIDIELKKMNINVDKMREELEENINSLNEIINKIEDNLYY